MKCATVRVGLRAGVVRCSWLGRRRWQVIVHGFILENGKLVVVWNRVVDGCVVVNQIIAEILGVRNLVVVRRFGFVSWRNQDRLIKAFVVIRRRNECRIVANRDIVWEREVDCWHWRRRDCSVVNVENVIRWDHRIVRIRGRARVVCRGVVLGWFESRDVRSWWFGLRHLFRVIAHKLERVVDD